MEVFVSVDHNLSRLLIDLLSSAMPEVLINFPNNGGSFEAIIPSENREAYLFSLKEIARDIGVNALLTRKRTNEDGLVVRFSKMPKVYVRRDDKGARAHLDVIFADLLAHREAPEDAQFC